MSKKYDFQKIEGKWQNEWEKNGIYRTPESVKGKKKFYHLVMFPYPSGDLHIGHWYNFAPADVYARYKRMRGFNVLSPIGFDAFGLPAENAAIKRKIHPKDWTMANIKTMIAQLKSMGNSYDWSREIITCLPEYYKWNQWFFLQFFKHGLAYRKKAPANWCPSCKTVLANEQVINGRCERCDTEVVQKEIEQWLLKITSYADRLLKNLAEVNWPEKTKTMQRNWIGKSEGALIDFEIAGGVASSYVLLHGYGGSPAKNFFSWLKKELESRGAKVYVPKLPQSNDPRVYDQVSSVLKSIPFDKNTVLVGHSLGGVVALKILEQLKKPVRKTVLAASFCKNTFLTEPFEHHTFDWKFDLKKIKANAGELRILRDTTDDNVPHYQADNLKNLFGGTVFDFAAEKSHVCGIQEPEVLRHCIDSIQVFTTRPDTLFGATYMILAPEHPLLANGKLPIANRKQVDDYIKKTNKKTDLQRTDFDKEKIGVELKGVKAINPANKEEIPIWVADYVLSGYGTGAIMAVPAHDGRDWEFAKKYKLPVRMVVCPHYPAKTCPILDAAYEGDGHLVDSGKFNGMASETAKWAITKFVGGKRKIQYRLRDWLISRQRYWGTPIPIVYCKKCGIIPVSEKDLPVLLPPLKNFKPAADGRSPLARNKNFLKIKCPKCGGPAERETDTMDTFVDSSWYYLRYIDCKNENQPFDKFKIRKWLPVDMYIGGAEHSVMHLLYSRFFTKFLYDRGYVDFNEPFSTLRHQGIILGPDSQKMSKSHGNVINPDELVKKFGADAVKIYLCFMRPYDQGGPWNPTGILGVSRFLERVYRFALHADIKSVSDPEIEKLLHKTIKKVGEDITDLHFNTGVSALMILLNKMEEKRKTSKDDRETFLKLLAPFAPHITEEIWRNVLNNKTSIHLESWPEYDPKLIEENTFTLIIQVNGKVRDTMSAAGGIREKEAKEIVFTSEKIKRFIEGKKVVKTIYVPGRLINIVTES